MNRKAADQLDLQTRFSDRQEQLSRKGGLLEYLDEVIGWEYFQPLLKNGARREVYRTSCSSDSSVTFARLVTSPGSETACLSPAVAGS